MKKDANRMEKWYLVGEPLFKPELRKEYHAPVGQLDLCQEILRETQDKEVVLQKLREEYIGIIDSLKTMGIDFRIIYSHKDRVDEKLIVVCIKFFGCRLVGFDRHYFAPAVIYPRDFATVLPGLILVNSKVARLMVRRKGDYRLLRSPYGEGGRVLNCGKTMLVSERIILRRGHLIKPKGLKKIRRKGIRIGLFPLPLALTFSLNGVKDRFFSNDHIDRVACLIKGRDGEQHLVIDPEIHTAYLRNYKGIPKLPRSPKETIERIMHICEPLGIEVHRPKRLEIPYSLNLVQFFDGRILMTSGDESVAEVISEIVGEEKVFKTPIPIRFFPVWAQAGIRCLINEAPTPLFKPKTSA